MKVCDKQTQAVNDSKADHKNLSQPIEKAREKKDCLYITFWLLFVQNKMTFSEFNLMWKRFKMKLICHMLLANVARICNQKSEMISHNNNNEIW